MLSLAPCRRSRANVFCRTLMKKFFVFLSVNLFLLVLAAKLQAQAPGNDLFANAWILTGTSVTTNGTDVNATKETGEPFHAGNRGGRSVWFKWTAPTNGVVRIDTLTSSFDTL